MRSLLEKFRPRNGERTLEEIDELITDMRRHRFKLAKVRQRIKRALRQKEQELEKGKPDEDCVD